MDKNNRSHRQICHFNKININKNLSAKEKSVATQNALINQITTKYSFIVLIFKYKYGTLLEEKDKYSC